MKTDSNPVKLLQDGKRITHPDLSDNEFIYSKYGFIFDECDLKIGTIEQFMESDYDFGWTEKED